MEYQSTEQVQYQCDNLELLAVEQWGKEQLIGVFPHVETHEEH